LRKASRCQCADGRICAIQRVAAEEADSCNCGLSRVGVPGLAATVGKERP
jgi:hypothetical protein